MGHFTATMEDHGLHFVAFAQESDDLIFAHLIIVLRGGRAELHFLDVRAFLVPLRLMRLFALLVEELSVVHELANGRNGVRRDFHHVQAGVARSFHRVEQGHDAELVSRVVDQSDLAGADALVDAKASYSTSFCDKTTSKAR